MMRTALLLLTVFLVASKAFASGPAKEQVTAGSSLFASSGCAHCHNDHAQSGAIGPNLADVGRRLKPDELRRQIHDGGAAMPAFGDILTGDEIEQLVAFLQTKRGGRPPAKASR